MSDIIEFVPPTDLPKLRTDPRVTLAEVVGNRAIYLWLDQSRTARRRSSPARTARRWTANPLKDRRVRQALSLAINRQGIVDRVMEGAADPDRPVSVARQLQLRARPEAAAV